MEDFITVYVGQFVSDGQVVELERYIARNIGIGSGFLNIYTQDLGIVRKAVDWLKARNINIQEIA